MTDSINRLHRAVLVAKVADPASSRTARLLRAGCEKMAKKLAEEHQPVPGSGAQDDIHRGREDD